MGKEEVFLKKWPITLAQFFKWQGWAENGAQAKEMVKEGCAAINGEICLIPGKQLFPGDSILFYPTEKEYSLKEE